MSFISSAQTRRTLGAAPTVTLQNRTTGDNSRFTIGDSWTLTITAAPPNAPVYLNANYNGLRAPMSGQKDLAATAWTGSYQDGNHPIGTTDSAGNWQSSGTFTKSQWGVWSQSWNVRGVLAGIDFAVTDAAGNLPPAGTTGDSSSTDMGAAYYTQTSNHAPADVAAANAAIAAAATGPTTPYSATGASNPAASIAAAASSLTQPAGGILPSTIADLLPASITALPIWIWIAAAGGAYFLFLRKR